MRISLLISILILFIWIGCSPTPNPQPDPNTPDDSTIVNDTSQVSSGWEVIGYNDDGHPVFFIKEDGDSTTTVSIIDGFVDYDMQYAILHDIRTQNRRMIVVAVTYMTAADISQWFYLDIVPDKINYDTYSPNQSGDGI